MSAQPIAPAEITRYIAPDIAPKYWGAEWLAIAPTEMVEAAQRLATHRTNYSRLWTHVVDVEDIFMQYGYGLPLPSAIQDYVRAGMAWDAPPRYLTLVGDTTLNTRQLECTGNGGCYPGWTAEEAVNVPTHLMYVDRFLGLIPSDHPYATVIGNDEVADLAVGRLTGGDSAEIHAIIDKIIQYETNLLTPDISMTDWLFISDDSDGAGDFCYQNQVTAGQLPDSYTSTVLCLPNLATQDDVVQLRNEVLDHLNGTGPLIANYRGHGSITDWGSGIMRVEDSAAWQNNTQPIVLLSADCLDGNFAWPGIPALSETFLTAKNKGTAAHWSSSGLGYTHEHNVLHTGFYDAIFDVGLTAIGDAINYAKLRYLATPYDRSELFAFTLQGDPAMQLLRSDLQIESQMALVESESLVEIEMTVRNDNLYPTEAAIYESLPVGMWIWGVESAETISTTHHAETGELIIRFQEPLHWGESASVIVQGQMAERSYSNEILSQPIVLSERGFDIAGNNSSRASVGIDADVTAVGLRTVDIATHWGSKWVAILLGILTSQLFRKIR